jgi:hypothetical protein
MDLKQFLELFDPRPGNKCLQVTTEIDETTLALEKLMQSVDGEMYVALYATQDIENYKNIHIQNIESFSKPFRAIPRDYDIVVFKDILNFHKNQKGILKIAYKTLANNANIIIMQKKNTLDIEATKSLLEEMEFRNPNEIDILSEFDVIVAKKLHMWGNGL